MRNTMRYLNECETKGLSGNFNVKLESNVFNRWDDRKELLMLIRLEKFAKPSLKSDQLTVRQIEKNVSECGVKRSLQ